MSTKPDYEREGSLSILDEVKVDHRNIADLLARFRIASAAKDTVVSCHVANTIIHEATVHAEAEELTIYKYLEKHNMKAVANHDREQHLGVKRGLANADDLVQAVDLTSSISDLIDLNKAINEAVEALLHHAKEEEEVQLPQLIKKLTAKENDELARSFLQARTLVTTRPHPSAPQTGGKIQMAAEFAAQPIDAAVEATRTFVPLMLVHPAQDNMLPMTAPLHV